QYSYLYVFVLIIVITSPSFGAPQVVDTTPQNYGANGNPSADGVIFSGNNTLQSTADGQNIGSSITTTAGSGTGVLDWNHTATFSATLGTSADTIGELHAGDAGKTLTLEGVSYIDDIILESNGTINFAANATVTNAINNKFNAYIAIYDDIIVSATMTTELDMGGEANFLGDSTISQPIGTAAVRFGWIRFGDNVTPGGTVLLGADLAASSMAVNKGSTLKLIKDVTIYPDGLFVGDFVSTTATFDADRYTLTLINPAGFMAFSENCSFKLAIENNSSFGRIDATGVNVFYAPATLNLNIDVTGYVSDGATFTVIDGPVTSALITNTTQPIIDNSAAVSFTSSAPGNQSLILTARRTPYNDLAGTSNQSAVGKALENAGETGATPDMLLILNELDTFSTQEEVQDALNSMEPNVNSSTPQVSFATYNQIINTLTSRLSAIRSGATGMSAGDPASAIGIWAKGFSSFIKQDKRDDIEGYKALVWGSSIGADNKFGDYLTLGLGGTYADSTVDPKASNFRDTDIKSYGGTLYASYTNTPWYIDGSFSFMWNTYKGGRNIDFGSVSRHAESDYDGQQYSTYIAGGYQFDLKGIKVSPLASLTWSHLRLESYSETGADSLNLKVKSHDYDLLQSGLGAKIEYNYNMHNGFTFIPEIHAMWLYDFIGDECEVTSRFSGGGGSFETTGIKPARHSLDIGTSLKLDTGSDISLILSYDFELKEDYYGHFGALTLRYDF
ncbi:MAG: autotransporter outer membrane beta-barrel domain-containing protein, partial [Candidatus Aureabacteria bacterium]|nr:autotransporter outer membrane beta-barrel domain-containing protein [Candidatus Auribacterota bacterium]